MAGHVRLLEQGLEHQRAGRFDQSVAVCRRVLRVEPANVTALELLTESLALQGQLDQAIEAATTWVRCDPDSVPPRQKLSNLLASVGQGTRSVEVWKEFAERTRGAPEALILLSSQLRVNRRGEEAVRVINDAVSRYPDSSYVRFEAMRVCERLGRIDAAREHADRVRPPLTEWSDYQVFMADVEAKSGDLAAARARLEKAAEMPQGRQRPEVRAALARLLEREKEFDAAFRESERAREIGLRASGLEGKQGVYVNACIREALALTRETVSAWPGACSVSDAPVLPPGVPAAPVFVVGFPRSGTTLIEQMLGALPRIAVTDEQPFLRLTSWRLFRRFLPRSEYPRDLRLLTRDQAAQGRRWYLDLAYQNLPAGGHRPVEEDGLRRRVLDKQPFNTVELPFVRAVFPESPVVCMLRDPRDTVLSVMLQTFDHVVPELYTLEGAARMFDGFARAWEHCREVLGLETMELRYEDLVADPETNARRVVQFIGEEWSDAVLNYHRPEHRRYVATPSYADVSKPVYTRAIGRWKNYERHLEPVLPILMPWVEKWGYK